MAEIMRREPWPLGRNWGQPFRRLFDDIVEGLEEERRMMPELWAEKRFLPAIDVKEDEKEVVLTAEFPGMNKEDLDCSVENGVLTLKGEKKEEKTTEKGNYHRVERRYGSFERRIMLPDYVDTKKIDASYKDGVLTLRMPKTEATKAKSIPIKGE